MNMNQSIGIYWCVFCVVVLCYATEMQRQLGNRSYPQRAYNLLAACVFSLY